MSRSRTHITAVATAVGIVCAAALAGPSMAAPGQIDLSDIAAGDGGFVINGQCAYERSGFSVASAGDVNGDGLVDLIVGQRLFFTCCGSAGHSYVVFGKTGATPINLSGIAAGRGGFVINGQCARDLSGYSVAGAGDVNGDGLADLIVGANGSDTLAGLLAGRSYVIFGKGDTTAIDLSAIATGRGGFVINGQCAYDRSGNSVASVGDANGDGLGDLIVGAFFGDPVAGPSAGRSYVIFGKTGTAAVDLSGVARGSGGFVINGECAHDVSGKSVASAGDVNGDGLADLIVGAEGGDTASGTEAGGRSYVIFGKTGTPAIDLSAIAAGSGGFVIKGECTYDFSGKSVAGAGDVNGDGLADLIVGAKYGDPGAGSSAGRSYVVFGKIGTAATDLSSVAAGSGGFVINGECAYDGSGTSVAGAADVNGDGLADLIVGAYRSAPAAGSYAGRSYVIFGSTTGAFSQTAVDQLGGDADDTLTGEVTGDVLVGGAGNDTLIGNGGIDVLYGGAGDDTFVLNRSNVNALSTGFKRSAALLARVDGGTGLDTLQLSGANITLDLSTIANQGGSAPGSASRVEAIERIDLTGSGNNTLGLNVNDVQDIAGMNLINSGTQAALGWSNGSYVFPAVVRRHQLIVEGDAGDVAASAKTTWINAGTAFNNGHTYVVYNSISGRSQALVNSEVTRIGLPGDARR
jgi:hypothetical protein